MLFALVPTVAWPNVGELVRDIASKGGTFYI
jgi:hypothetical protein